MVKMMKIMFLQLLFYVSKIRKDAVRNGMGRVSSRIVAPPHLPLVSIMGEIAT